MKNTYYDQIELLDDKQFKKFMRSKCRQEKKEWDIEVKRRMKMAGYKETLRLGVNVTPEIHKRFKKIAQDHDMTIQDLLHQIVEEFIKHDDEWPLEQ